MRDDAGLIGLGVVSGQWIVEECQHTCREREADEKGRWEGEWKSHGKERGSFGTIPSLPDRVKQYKAGWA